MDDRQGDLQAGVDEEAPDEGAREEALARVRHAPHIRVTGGAARGPV